MRLNLHNPIVFFWVTAMSCLHELCHLFMAYLMYPFGIRVTDFGVRFCKHRKTKKYKKISMYVVSRGGNALPNLLVSAAPAIFSFFAAIFLLSSGYYVWYFLLLINAPFLNLSTGDRDNIRNLFNPPQIVCSGIFEFYQPK